MTQKSLGFRVTKKPKAEQPSIIIIPNASVVDGRLTTEVILHALTEEQAKALCSLLVQRVFV